MESKFKKPTVVPKVADIMDTPSPSSFSGISKWIPLICAGAAAGVSLIALQEIKNLRREIVTMKQTNNTPSTDKETSKRIENMERQMKTLAEFIKNKEKVSKEAEIIKNVVRESETIRIINDNGEEEEYEEIEVTDDEADDPSDEKNV